METLLLAIALLVCAAGIPIEHSLRDRQRARWWMVGGGLTAITLVGLSWGGIASIIAAPLLVDIAGILIQHSLRDRQTVHGRIVGEGLIAITLAGLLLGYLGSGGSWGSIWAFITSLTMGVVAIIICAWLVWSLPRWRKLAALGFAAAIALMIVVSNSLGIYHFSPEATVERNAETIVRALEEFHAESHRYPATLDELVPAHLPTLPEAVTTQGTGWLYQSTGTTYVLGYWMWPDKEGSYLCLFRSGSEGEECHFARTGDDWEPFTPVMTATPTPVSVGN